MCQVHVGSKAFLRKIAENHPNRTHVMLGEIRVAELSNIYAAVAGVNQLAVADIHTHMGCRLVRAGGVLEDDQIATLQIWYRTSCVAETELYAMSSVRSTEDSELDIQSAASRDDSNLTDLLSFLGVVCLVIFVPLVLYLFINNMRRAMAMKRRRRRRRSRRRSR